MFVPLSFSDRGLEWEDFTLIMPAVSVGNVGQLAADLFINTLCAERIGYLYDDCFLPMVGNDPFYVNSESDFSLATSCDVYCSTEHKVVIIQQRAEFVKGKRKQFRDQLLRWIGQEKFKLVVVLSSSYAQLRRDQQMRGSLFRYLATSKLRTAPVGDELVKLGWTELEKQAIDSEDSGDSVLRIAGGGIAKTLYEDCEAAGIPLAVILMFCSEGDNTTDAVQLASFSNTWLRLVKHKTVKQDGNDDDTWQIPKSWSLNFGSCTSMQLYN